MVHFGQDIYNYCTCIQLLVVDYCNKYKQNQPFFSAIVQQTTNISDKYCHNYLNLAWSQMLFYMHQQPVISMRINKYRHSSHMVYQPCQSYSFMNMYMCGFIGIYRLLDLMIVIPLCLSELKLEKSENRILKNTRVPTQPRGSLDI